MPVVDIEGIEQAASFLLNLRTTRSRVQELPGALIPGTLHDAYAVQDSLHRQAGWEIAWLKVGCTSEAACLALGISHPIGGRLPRKACLMSGAAIPRSFFGEAPLLECEFALRLNAEGRVDAVAPALELVDPRVKWPKGPNGLAIVADNSLGTAIVLGPSTPVDQVGDLNSIKITLRQGSEELAAGSAAAVLGGPMASIQWLLEHEKARGRTVPAGTWVITGTCSGLVASSFGATYTATFEGLNEVTFSLEQ